MRSLLVACVTIGALASPAMAGPTLELTAEVWRRQLLPEEPILARITLSNLGPAEVRVVPPLFGGRSFGLGLAVETKTGQWEQAVLRGTDAYWVWAYNNRKRAPLVRAPWPLEPLAHALGWHSLNMVHSLHEPGRYHLRLVYDPRPEMLQVPGDPVGPVPEDLVCERLEADLGWIEIIEPPESEKPVAEYLRKHAAACAASLWSGPYEHYAAVAERRPGSAYLPYLSFYAMGAEAQKGLQHGAHCASGMEDLRSEVEAFRAAYPDFPLNHQLGTLVAWYKYGVVHDTVYPPVAPPIPIPTREQVLALVQAGRDLKAVAQASEDRGLLAEVEAHVSWIELVHRKHIDAALAGREPE